MEAASGTSVPEAASVSVDGRRMRRVTCRYSRLVVRRGSLPARSAQGHIRGLATAGRLFGRNGAAALRSGVASAPFPNLVLPIGVFADRSSRCHHTVAIVYRPKSRVALQKSGHVVDHRQRPSPSRELSGDGNIGDHRALLTSDELRPSVM